MRTQIELTAKDLGSLDHTFTGSESDHVQVYMDRFRTDGVTVAAWLTRPEVNKIAAAWSALAEEVGAS